MGTLVGAIYWFFNIVEILILANVLLSWLPKLRSSGLGGVVLSLTEPILSPFRWLIAKSPLNGPGLMLDFSPFLAFVSLQWLSTFLQSVVLSL